MQCVSIMGRIGFYTVLALLVSQCTADYHRVWFYKADVKVKNTADESYASMWFIDANVTAQGTGTKATVKFDNVKTAVLNGHGGPEVPLQYMELPKESDAIYKPFVVDMTDPNNATILHEPDDPVWSVNLKKGLANNFIISTKKTLEGQYYHPTIYGRCQITSSKREEDGQIIIEKVIDHTTCNGSPSLDFGVRTWDPTNGEHTPITVDTKYSYYYSGSVENLNMNLITTSSVVQYKSMPGVSSAQKIEQEKRLELAELITDDSFKKIDVSKATVVSTLTFDYSKGLTGGRDETNPKKSSNELIAEYNTEYERFKKYFNTIPLVNVDDDTGNITAYSMYELLVDMEEDALKKLSIEVFAKEDNFYQQLFLGILPHLGTKDAAKFIKYLIENDDENINDLFAIKILSTFPVYLNDYSADLVTEMSPLLTLKVSNPQVKYAGILSFASLVNDVYQHEKIEKEIFEKYTAIYYKHFTDSAEYEEKLTYLLGLINMKDNLPKEIIFEICSNKDISRHSRALAIYGFKPAMKSQGEDVYKHFWPIVKDHTEHHEVRVAALDLLLYSELSYEQFETIIHWYHDEFQNPDEQHLANYLYTTIQALENSTGYYEYLGEYATEAIKTMKPIKNDHVWTTGNYRMAFTDEDANFGGSIQARLVANPNSNIIDVGILSVDTFAASFKLGAYTAYIKTQGIPDLAFIFIYLNNRDSESPLPHLLELIKTHGYKIKEFEDAHIDVVIFCDDRAVFGMHIDKDNIDNYAENPLFLDLVKLLIDYNSLSFPLEESSYIVSDIGTGIEITHYMSDLDSYEVENLDKFFAALKDDSEEVDAIEYNTKYRSMWTYSVFAGCYNPLADLSAETYKYFKDEKYINIPFSFNLTDFVFKWKHTEDSFNWIQDHILGVYIDEDRLPEYCSSCPSIDDIPTGDMEERDNRMYFPPGVQKFFGVKLNITVSEQNEVAKNLGKDRSVALFEVFKSHRTNSFDVSFVTPVLYYWHAVLYNTFINHDLYKMSVRTMPYWNESTEMVFDLDMDVNDIKNDKDPIGGEEFDFTVGLTNRKSHNAEVLTHFNSTFIYKTKSESPEGEAQPHIEHIYDIKLSFEDSTKDKMMVCINRKVLYPNRRVDKFSLEPVEPTKATTFIRYKKSEETDDCADTDSFTLIEIYTGTDKQKQYLESMEEYGKCRKEIEDHKYKFVPPTSDCLEAHEVISRYDAATFYADVSNITAVPSDYTAKNEYGLEILKYRRINSTYVNVTFSGEILGIFIEDMSIETRNKKTIETEDLGDLMTLSPSVVAYGDHDLVIGVKSACHVTPQQIITFHGKEINDYHGKFGPDAVAFVECSNDSLSLSGLTIQKVGDNKVGFNFWSENNTLVASASDGKVKVVHNGKPVSETDIKDEDFKVYFLDQDVIYVTNGIVDIQYSTEYISVKAPTIYNNYICGLCAGDSK